MACNTKRLAIVVAVLWASLAMLPAWAQAPAPSASTSAPASKQLAPGFKHLQLGERVLLMPIDVELYSVTAGGVQEPRADWTAKAHANLTQAIQARQKTARVEVVELAPDQADEFAEQQGLHAAVAQAIALHQFGDTMWALPTKGGRLDWSFGDAMRPLRDASGARYALFILVRDSYTSAERVAMQIVIGALTAALGLAQARWGQGGRFCGRQPDLAALRQLVAEPLYWRMILLFGLAIGSTLGIYTMLPLYLVIERGLDPSWANSLIGLSRISTLVMALASGWITDRFGARRTIVVVFLFTGSATLALALAKGQALVAVVLLQPMVAVCFFPAGFAVLSAIGSAAARNLAVSMTAPVAFLIGGGVLPTVIGFFGDLGRFSLGIGLAGALMLCGTAVAFSLKLPRSVTSA